MYLLYNFLIPVYGFFAKIIQFFSPKIKLWVKGRKDWRTQLKSLNLTNPIWVHCASLGEFEQGLPLMEALKKEYPNQSLLVTFYSPSGYEIRKNHSIADGYLYLPLDTKKNMTDWVKILNPKLCILIKYEFWPNLLQALHFQNIKIWSISTIFHETHHFFKGKNHWMLPFLKMIDFYFVQNKQSAKLLEQINIKNYAIAGDTRFDSVLKVKNNAIEIPFIANFKKEKTLVVCGSTWNEDEDFIIDFILNDSTETKYIIAPHNIKNERIDELEKQMKGLCLRYTKPDLKVTNPKVYILDTIGILKSVYAYADITYVGGGFTKSGIHNILEPAVFGTPVIWGPNYKKFQEAQLLKNEGGGFSYKTKSELFTYLQRCISDKDFRTLTGRKSSDFVEQYGGATAKIIQKLKQDSFL